ncbi:metal-dependent transcriptional regulator [Vagococcus xieshaowenii]|uniref:Manganese transport regulator n=1 Tax=Vagococcus xieshaowenii TaxID=2562451 RepID=A0A4Z0DAK2_9ENTE|nr:metal-dependent transcriptional regulator [Vagococcus xieshaowenii]QCA29205.1 metal-dependent transcriptional regulator [Vagococcus xieshaowenii]TFZ41938.1 metal-dependent transcriptional regulator [Vagococcus xieshaowenii]
MTPNKEDYLKLMYELGAYRNKISNKSIVAGLNVSPASVSEMVSKLEKDNLVTHTPYQGVQLTEQGMIYASSLIRKHRLWEVFLVEHLNYSWEEVHVEAEILEHATSDILSNRLESFLNNPEFCPHGGIIPSLDTFIEEPNQLSLNTRSEQDRVVIKRVLDETELLEYLAEIGLQINDIVTIKKIGAYEGPIILTNEHGKDVMISYKAASNVFIDVL